MINFVHPSELFYLTTEEQRVDFLWGMDCKGRFVVDLWFELITRVRKLTITELIKLRHQNCRSEFLPRQHRKGIQRFLCDIRVLK